MLQGIKNGLGLQTAQLQKDKTPLSATWGLKEDGLPFLAGET